MKKAMVLFLVLVQSILLLSAQAAGTREEKLNELSRLLKKGSAPNVKLSGTEKKKLEELLRIILPDKAFIGKGREWNVVYHDMDKGDFFSVDLKKRATSLLINSYGFIFYTSLRNPNSMVTKILKDTEQWE